jgi:hypothetical protein
MKERFDDIAALQELSRPIEPLNALLEADPEARGENLDQKQQRFILLVGLLQRFWREHESLFRDRIQSFSVATNEPYDYTAEFQQLKPISRVLTIVGDFSHSVIVYLDKWIGEHSQDDSYQRLATLLSKTKTPILDIPEHPTPQQVIESAVENAAANVVHGAQATIYTYELRYGRPIDGPRLAGVLRRSRRLFTAMSSLHIEELQTLAKMKTNLRGLGVPSLHGLELHGNRKEEYLALAPGILRSITAEHLRPVRTDEPRRIGCPAIYVKTTDGRTLIDDFIEKSARHIEQNF